MECGAIRSIIEPGRLGDRKTWGSSPTGRIPNEMCIRDSNIPICTRFLKLLLSAVVFTAFVPELFIRPSLLFEFNSQEDLRLIRCHHFEIKSPESVLQIQGFDIPSYVLLSSRLWLSVMEFHHVSRLRGSRTIPPVGNYAPPRRFLLSAIIR